jgi:hypothetical protein
MELSPSTVELSTALPEHAFDRLGAVEASLVSVASLGRSPAHQTIDCLARSELDRRVGTCILHSGGIESREDLELRIRGFLRYK